MPALRSEGKAAMTDAVVVVRRHGFVVIVGEVIAVHGAVVVVALVADAYGTAHVGQAVEAVFLGPVRQPCATIGDALPGHAPIAAGDELEVGRSLAPPPARDAILRV